MSKKLIAVEDGTHAYLVRLSTRTGKPIKAIASRIINAHMRARARARKAGRTK